MHQNNISVPMRHGGIGHAGSHPSPYLLPVEGRGDHAYGANVKTPSSGAGKGWGQAGVIAAAWLFGVGLGADFGAWAASPAGDASAWVHPLVKKGKLNSPLVEVTPFVFKDRLYLLENWQKQWEYPGSPDGSHFQEDQVRIRDLADDRIVSVAFTGHGLGMALVWSNRVHVFAGNWGTKQKWGIDEIAMRSSADLRTWSEPVVVLRAEPQEKFFNVSVCRGRESFVLLIETNDPKWRPFTFKYFTSPDLVRWTAVPDGIYGADKYVGGPALYCEGGWYYTLYLELLGPQGWETRITRSQDLKHWQDAAPDRPFVTFNPTNTVHALRPAAVREKNASDAEVVYWRGKTLVYFTGGDQQLAGDLQWAEFNGPPRELFERFFDEKSGPSAGRK